jgi:hypothetical protein
MGAPVAGQIDPPFVLPIEQIVATQLGSVGGNSPSCHALRASECRPASA